MKAINKTVPCDGLNVVFVVVVMIGIAGNRRVLHNEGVNILGCTPLQVYGSAVEWVCYHIVRLRRVFSILRNNCKANAIKLSKSHNYL